MSDHPRLITPAKRGAKATFLGLLALPILMLAACGQTDVHTILQNPSPDPVAVPSGLCVPPVCEVVALEMRDFAFAPSHIKVRAEKVRLILTNAGTLTHAIEVQISGGGVGSGNIGPGQTSFLDINVPTGETSIVCPVGGHGVRGQRAVIVRSNRT